MKILYPFIFQFLLITEIKSQLPYYEIGDTIIVLAKSGINLRDSTSATSKKIQSVPFGTKLVTLDQPRDYVRIEKRSGSWIKVKYGSVTGYAFSGFLTDLKIPKFDEHMLQCNNLRWFEDVIRANMDTLLHKGTTLKKGFDIDGKDWHQSMWEIYKDGTMIDYQTGYEWSDLMITTNRMAMNDILNLLDIYIDKLMEFCSPSYFEDGIKPKIEVTGDSYQTTKVSCPHFLFQADQVLNKIVIQLHVEDS
ncbi:MAG TPA: SH3 domain-containing protein [Saprospiraceae bacterium]|nr:SH3 domain-containing protein [Saprospiraceae bacterium]